MRHNLTRRHYDDSYLARRIVCEVCSQGRGTLVRISTKGAVVAKYRHKGKCPPKLPKPVELKKEATHDKHKENTGQENPATGAA